jgi:predicted dehydrogenase
VLKVAIVGCGKIAVTHVSQIRRVGGAEIVGVCSRNSANAREFAARHSLPRSFDSLTAALNEGRPEVVHITAPPDSHFQLAQQCLEHGAHVYVEKPFTLDTAHCETLIRLAESKGLKVTVGHNQQFQPAARRMRALIARGYLGGQPVHMESQFGYDLGDRIYSRAMLEDRNHWVRSLPGQLLHNVISHAVARIAEFLEADNPEVIAIGFTSSFLHQKGERDLIDELRVIIRATQATAYLTFSSQMRPLIHEFRVFGPRNSLVLDQDHEAVIQLRGEKFKSYSDWFLPPVISAAQQLKNMGGNALRFTTGDLRMNSGMQYLIGAFYRSILHDEPVPISYREIILTATIMDRIFEQLHDRERSPQAEGQTHPQGVG